MIGNPIYTKDKRSTSKIFNQPTLIQISEIEIADLRGGGDGGRGDGGASEESGSTSVVGRDTIIAEDPNPVPDIGITITAN